MSDSDRESFDERESSSERESFYKAREAFDGKTFDLWLNGEEKKERLEIEEERKRLAIEKARSENEEKKERILKATIREELKPILLDRPFIFIDDILFVLFSKHKRPFRKLQVYIFFVLSDGTFDSFWCYQSTSEIGLWRFCWERNVRKYSKGTLDYVQGTLIHLTLQRLINEHIQKLEIMDDESYRRCKACSISDSTERLLEDRNRVIEEPPFTYLQDKKTNERIACGKIPSNLYKTDRVSELMNAFSESFTEQFEVDMNSLELITSYQCDFEMILIADVSLYRILLHRKPIDLSRFQNPPTQDTVVLYFSKVKLNVVRFSDPRFKENVTRICGQDFHIFPFLLTIPQAKITPYGFYSHFIPSGIFICKLFDYYDSENHYQCTFKEEQTGKCSSLYAYIGSRYTDIFPINRIIEHFHTSCILKDVKKPGPFTRIIEHFRRPWRPSPTVTSLSSSPEHVKKAGPGGRRSKKIKRRRKRTYKKKYQYLKNP
jgi:hypothetical protein